jgi:hypothetical protein
MATMSPPFATGERRKKTVTYGRSGRYSTTTNFFDDATSPKRLRKPAGAVFATIEKSGAPLGLRTTLRNNRIKPTASLDVFDVPSDNEPTPRAPSAAPLKKIAQKHEDAHLFDFPAEEDEQPKKTRPVGRVVRPLRKAEVAQPSLPALQKQQERVTTDAPLPTTRRRAKNPQVPADPAPIEKTQPARRTARSRATTPAPLVADPRKKGKEKEKAKKAKDTVSAVARKHVAKPPSPVESQTLDVFDVPSSDEDMPARTPMRPKPVPISRPKVGPAPGPPSPSPSIDTDVSHTSNKRKRRASVSLSTTAKGTGVAKKGREPSVPPRNKKCQKKENTVSPGHDVVRVPSLVQKVPEEPVIHKPKRTRLRTAAPLPRIPVSKGQSSPAKLHTMLTDRSKPKLAAVPVEPEPPIDMDETMYEAEDIATPRARPQKAALPTSTTPRQQALFDNLLNDSSTSDTAMPNVSSLKLTEGKPKSVITSLLRSSSDIPQSTHTRKGRLIDMLKQAGSSSDEDSESESEEETEQEMIKIPNVSAPAKSVVHGRFSSQDISQSVSHTMEIDPEPLGNSQASQTSINLHAGGKVTYAKQRSYLEEQGDNMEDMLALALDDDLGLDNNHGLTSEEDELIEPVRGIHELRRQGQHQKFHGEAQSAIDDIAGQGGLNPSQRRSAMMDFATSMADKSYVGQLLESSLTSSLLRSISSKGEVIFDLAAAAAVLLILETRPGGAILEQIYQSSILTTLDNLLASKFASLDIHRISKERKTNMAPRARETVLEFRTLIHNLTCWPREKPEKISPQLLAVKVLDLLVVGLRQAGNGEALVDETMITKIVDATAGPCQRLKAGKATAHDCLVLDMSFSALESLSVSQEGQATWSNDILTRLADLMPAILETNDIDSPVRLAIRLCINLTNDRPKACQIFARSSFVLPLLRFIGNNFVLLASRLDEKRKTEVLEDLIFSVGAMINLAECSEQARASSIQDGDDVVGDLVQIFLDGSDRADQVNINSFPHTNYI